MTPLKAIIVDDEPLARENIEALLQKDPRIVIAAHCANGRQAIAAVREHRPELMFLDVQMPGMDGFDVLAELGADAPEVIFVTAYDQYAIRAFEVNALDYLLKPFSRQRFFAALERAKIAIDGTPADGAGPDALAKVIRHLNFTGAEPPAAAAVADSWSGRLLFRSDGEIHVISPADIRWIKAEGDYLKLFLADRARLVRMPLVKVLERLDPQHFVRIHRSVVVNLNHVRKLAPTLYGEYQLELSDGTKLKVSRTYVPQLKSFM